MNPRILAATLLLLVSCHSYADADGPDFWRVENIPLGSFLNLRNGPSTKFAVIGKIPYNATGLANLGCFPEFSVREWNKFSKQETKLALELRWCRVSFGNLEGWSYAKYLME